MAKYSINVKELNYNDKLLFAIERIIGSEYYIPWRVIANENIVSVFVFEHDRFYKKVVKNWLLTFEYDNTTDDKYQLVEKESII